MCGGTICSTAFDIPNRLMIECSRVWVSHKFVSDPPSLIDAAVSQFRSEIYLFRGHDLDTRQIVARNRIQIPQIY